MANVCACCGRKISFLDVDSDLVEIAGGNYYVCSSCNSNFSAFKKGNLSLEELVNDLTKPKLKHYFEEAKQKEEQEVQRLQQKLVVQKNNPLYDDLHQIAGDLRFIKNLIMVGLVCGGVLGIIIMCGRL